MISFFGVFIFCYFVSLITLYPGTVATFYILIGTIITVVNWGWFYGTVDWINFGIRILIAIGASYAGFLPAWIHLRSWSKFKMFILKIFPRIEDLRRITGYGIVWVILITIWVVLYELATIWIKVNVPGPSFIHSGYQIGLDSIIAIIILFTLFAGLLALNPRFWNVTEQGTPIGEENVGTKHLAAFSWVYIIGIVATFISFISLTLRLVNDLIGPNGEDWIVVLIIIGEMYVYALVVIFATKYYSRRWAN